VAELRARDIVMTPSGVDLILQDIMLGTAAKAMTARGTCASGTQYLGDTDSQL
jgi:hypothetical protein